MNPASRILPILIALLPVSHLSASDDVPPFEPLDSLVYTNLEEVSITAVKQGEDLRNQPVAATIVTSPELERLNAFSIKGISDVVPNFYIPDYGSRITSTIYVRGIGARIDQPSVGLNVDNIPYLYKDAFDYDLGDIISMEMLRGPQSTLFGRNTMAGLINITTLSPMDYQGWRLLVRAASGNSFKINPGWYHKTSDKFAFAASLNISYGAGFFTNEYDHSKVDRERMMTARFKSVWRPTKNFHVNNVVSANFLRQGGYPYAFKDTGKIEYNDTCFYHRIAINDGLTLRYFGDKVNITSVSTYQYLNDNLTIDQDFLPLSYFTLTQKKVEMGLTQDLVIKPAKKGKHYNWLFGAFAFYEHLSMRAPVDFKDDGIEELIEEHRNQANPDYPIKWDSRQFRLNSNFKLPNWGIAAYHESKLAFNNLEFTAGLRLDYERASLTYRSFCNTGYTIYSRQPDGDFAPLRNVPLDIDDTGRESRHSLTLLPKFTALYSFSNDNNIYANVAKGYKAGGYNTQMFSDVLQQKLMSMMGIGAQYDVADIVGYKPEVSWNYEVGSHITLFDNKLDIDAAIFYIYCKNQQITTFPDGTTTGRIMTNAGKTRSFGVEASLTMKPLERMVLRANYGYTNARFIKYFDGIHDYKGNTIPYVPMNTLYLQMLYTFPNVTDWLHGLTFEINGKGTGRILWNEANTEKQNFYFLTGASATFSGSKVELQLWAKNLYGVNYDTFYFVSMENTFFQRGRQHEMGVTLRLYL